MQYISVCSGIEAATTAWHHMGWKPLAFAEIEPFPAAVLAHHYPDVPNYGDMTTYTTWEINDAPTEPLLLVGGTPCQSFSVAGLRKGLSDERGNLALEFCRMADWYDVDVVLWENVPGVLSSKDNAFGCFLAGLAGEDEPLVPPGGKWTNAGYVLGPERAVAWRVLDAQYFGVAQRRRRVFVVACPTDGADPRTILFESEGVRRDTPPSREKREGVAENAGQSTPGAGGQPYQDIAHCLNAGGMGRIDYETESFVVNAVSVTGDIAHTLNTANNGKGCSEDGTGRGVPTIAFHHNAQACQLPNEGRDTSISDPLTCSQQAAVATSMQVRRLTPTECERLQGFPDGYTDIPWKGKDCSPDGPRYKALGNSMAVPVMRWIGERINNHM